MCEGYWLILSVMYTYVTVKKKGTLANLAATMLYLEGASRPKRKGMRPMAAVAAVNVEA